MLSSYKMAFKEMALLLATVFALVCPTGGKKYSVMGMCMLACLIDVSKSFQLCPVLQGDDAY